MSNSALFYCLRIWRIHFIIINIIEVHQWEKAVQINSVLEMRNKGRNWGTFLEIQLRLGSLIEWATKLRVEFTKIMRQNKLIFLYWRIPHFYSF